MKRYKIEVVGSKHPSNQVDADYMVTRDGSFYFRNEKECGTDKTVAIFPDIRYGHLILMVFI